MLEGEVLFLRSVGSYSDGGPEAFAENGRLRFMGLEVFRALKYRPQALQVVEPVGDLLQRGVLLVPQLLLRCVSYLNGVTRSLML